MSKYYVLEKHMSDEQGLTIKSPFDYFSQSVIECEELGEEPFSFSTLERKFSSSKIFSVSIFLKLTELVSIKICFNAVI